MARNNHVNASLIREVRMIAQQLLLARSMSGMTKANSKRQDLSHISSLKCIHCLREGNPRPRNAIAVSNGDSICDNHSSATNC
jgi:hypothetical protein